MGKKIILNFFKRHKYAYITGIFIMLLSSYIQTLLPKILGNTIDILKVKNFDLKTVQLNVVYMLIITFLTFALTYLWRNLIIGNGRSLECYLREELYKHMQTLSIEFYNKRKTGELISYAINDISAVRVTFGPATARTVNSVILCVITIYSMCSLVGWGLTILTIIPIPLIIYVMLKIGKQVQKRFKKVQESFAAISDRVQENIYGVRVIKSYAQEEQEIKSFEKLNDQIMEANLSMVRITSFLSPIVQVCFSISFVMNLIIGGNLVQKGAISLGDFIAFNGYLIMLINPITTIGRIITVFQRGVASFKRLNEIFDVRSEVEDGEKGIKKNLEGKIEIKALNFSYPSAREQALKKVEIEIPKGYAVGIVGKTGSGKTTLVNLLLKLYNVEKEKILIDGIDINDFSLKSLREGIGYVPQDNFLFSTTIRENIKFFKKEYSEEEVIKAAKISEIYESIKLMPNGLDTVLGERGVNLSGGQKQRISIARAIIKNPPILILDDALSAVDTITESKILKNLKELRVGKTTIIIAHRLSTIKEADLIVVLSKGEIVEMGTHSQLLKKGGLYYETYMEQSKPTSKVDITTY